MAEPESIHRGRRAFAERRWGEAYAQYAATDRHQPLAADDLECFAATAYLVGRDAEAIALWTRAHHECIDAGDPCRAARLGAWLSLVLLLGGEIAPANGWLARARRLLALPGVANTEASSIPIILLTDIDFCSYIFHTSPRPP